MEIVKLGQVYFINRDKGLFYEESKQYPICRATNINEDLGQIRYIFSDKTGTLTENKMEFKRFSVGGMTFSHPSGMLCFLNNWLTWSFWSLLWQSAFLRVAFWARWRSLAFMHLLNIALNWLIRDYVWIGLSSVIHTEYFIKASLKRDFNKLFLSVYVVVNWINPFHASGLFLCPPKNIRKPLV